jgi:Ca2+-binding RTX toxin-like protein
MAGMNLVNDANGWADGSYNFAYGGDNGANPEPRHQLAGDDTLIGGAANDTLDGGTGNDLLTGGAATTTSFSAARWWQA